MEIILILILMVVAAIATAAFLLMKEDVEHWFDLLTGFDSAQFDPKEWDQEFDRMFEQIDKITI